jgi:hypothetical protein
MTHAPQTRERALAAYQQGKPLRFIHDQLGVYRTLLYRWKRRAAIPNRKNVGGALLRKVEPAKLRHLHAEKLTDGQIAARLGVHRVTACHWRNRLGLPSNGRKGQRLFALALLLLGGTAQAQGFQPHPVAGMDDPFAKMTTVNGVSCCHSRDCGYTEECSPSVGGLPGVMGPDGQCHHVPDDALLTRHCAVGQTSACFAGSLGGLWIRCACLGGV